MIETVFKRINLEIVVFFVGVNPRGVLHISQVTWMIRGFLEGLKFFIIGVFG